MNIKNKRIVVTGGAGFLGEYVVKELEKKGVQNIIVPRSKKYDLRNRKTCEKVVKDVDIVIHLAAEIGGIGFISEHPGEMLYNNLIMGVELMEASRLAKVKKFVGIGTVCEYPRVTAIPFKERDLWDGYPDESTASYGLAKKILVAQGKAYRKQYGFNAIHLLPVNLYGPGDNFDRKSSHVIPSLIKKVIEARDTRKRIVEVWGSGTATREFLYVEDAAKGIISATERYDSDEPINLGTGIETSIKDVTKLIMELAHYTGKIQWNSTKPDGQPRRCLDVSLAKEFGFMADTTLKEGLKKTIAWYESTRV